MDKIQSSRLLFIHQQINSGLCYNAEQLAEKYGVSARTIQRDIRFMKEEWGAPIASKGLNRGYYYTKEFIGVPAMTMNEGELLSLLVLEKMLPYYQNTPFASSLREIQKNMIGLLPQKIKVKESMVFSKMSILFQPIVVSEIKKWEIILQALESSKSIKISYTSQYTQKQKQKPIEREVHPYHIVGSNGGWYLIAFDEYSQSERIFAFSRIESISLEKKSFDPKDIKIDDYIDSPWGLYNNEDFIVLELEYTEDIATLIEERVWHPSQEITRQKNGRRILQITTGQVTPLLHWILSWGADMRVRKPKFLADRMKDELTKSLNQDKFNK